MSFKKSRNLLCLVVWVCLLSNTGCRSLNQPAFSVKIKQEMNPAQSIRHLEEGNQRFVTGHLAEKHVIKNRKQLISEQKPVAVVISCSDSRIAPEIVFDQSLGDLFVIRVAGNIVNDDVIGSVQYAVDHLHVPLVLVLGHENCGAVIEALQRRKHPAYLQSIVNKIEPAAEKAISAGITETDIIDRAVIENVKMVEDELHEHSALNEKLVNGDLKIIGGEYHLESGKVTWIK
ncbi:carbonic anhydrase [Paenibacillus alginolyticus]|uniref:carbonic anhydrase n=1 Tax=Paenibacillus alginolyticus TaxID=59839 RepID=UPI001377719F|nr:carbonic anhydrase [Paenibacillus alginolyticus]MCY9667593.1 carbonic anhydrase [Paenibacillus alginolyticus]